MQHESHIAAFWLAGFLLAFSLATWIRILHPAWQAGRDVATAPLVIFSLCVSGGALCVVSGLWGTAADRARVLKSVCVRGRVTSRRWIESPGYLGIGRMPVLRVATTEYAREGDVRAVDLYGEVENHPLLLISPDGRAFRANHYLADQSLHDQALLHPRTGDDETAPDATGTGEGPAGGMVARMAARRRERHTRRHPRKVE